MSRLTWVALASFLALSALVARSRAQQRQIPISDLPVLSFAYQRGLQRAALRFSCVQDASASKAQIDCEFDVTNFWLMSDKARVDAEVDQFLKEATAKPADFAKMCTHYTSAPLQADPVDAAFYTAAKDACSKKDPKSFGLAMHLHLMETDAKTCKLNLHEWRESFEQQDKDTWISRSGPRGICNDSYVSTIWRDPKDKTFWNYKQTQVTPQNPPQLCGKKPGEVMEHVFVWKPERVDLQKELGCKFLRL